MYNLEISMAFIITELIYIRLWASWRTPPGSGISRYIEELLVTFCRCFFYGVGLLSLWYIPHFHSRFYASIHKSQISFDNFPFFSPWVIPIHEKEAPQKQSRSAVKSNFPDNEKNIQIWNFQPFRLILTWDMEKNW